jgi:lipoyl(octanoyl) transferase
MPNQIYIRQSGQSDYQTVYESMARITSERDEHTPDEIWCLQHPPVFTLGLGSKEEHILAAGDIPIIRTDRGGQVTYHGPGQLVVYLMLDLQRRGLTIKRYVALLEQAMIDMCATHGIHAHRKAGAPGVYVSGKKIAALGIRVKRGCSYHGLALNVDMDLAPFRRINPCGFPGLEVTQLKDQGCVLDINATFATLLPCILKQLGYADYEQTKIAGQMTLLRTSQAA